MDNYRLNVVTILEQFQILYQNNRIQNEKNDLVKLTKLGLSDWSAKIELGKRISMLLEKEPDEFFQKIYEKILQQIN